MTEAGPLPNTVSPSSPDDTFRERYLQTYLKPKVNVVLQNHQKSRYVKDMPDWSRIAKRLERVSVNTISTLRHDYYEGWKTWDGSPFRHLAETLPTNAVSANIKAGPVSRRSAPAAVDPNSPIASKPHVKLNLGHKAKANTKSKARKAMPAEEYNPEDGEYTASKSVSIMSSTSSMPSILLSLVPAKQCDAALRLRVRLNIDNILITLPFPSQSKLVSNAPIPPISQRADEAGPPNLELGPNLITSNETSGALYHVTAFLTFTSLQPSPCKITSPASLLIHTLSHLSILYCEKHISIYHYPLPLPSSLVAPLPLH